MNGADVGFARPLITVLVISYNYGRYIEQAIDSVLAQEFPLERVEILVVDDGSTDDTAERMKKYGAKIQYLRKENGGQASALNYGLARAQGEIVTFLDADDWFLPKRLARIADAFEADPAVGMVYHQIERWYEDGGERRGWDFVEISGDLRKEPKKFNLYLTPPNLAISFRREALRKLLPIPERIRMLADCYLAALIPFIAPVRAVPEVLAVYRIHGQNSHHIREQGTPLEIRQKRLRTWQVVIEAMREWLAENGQGGLPQTRIMEHRWELFLERHEFEVDAPGRLRAFRYLLQTYRYQYPLMGGKLRLINLANAFGSLLVGYRGLPELDQRREKITQKVRAIIGRARSTGPSN